MVKSKSEEVTITKRQIVESATYCDICGKLIGIHKWDKDGTCKPTKGSQKYYWSCETSHSDWGRDSVDSIENADVCSEECLKKWINSYIDDPDDYETREFEIEHKGF